MLSICDTADFTPINEAVIMEQFMEFLLEKSSPSEAYSTTYVAEANNKSLLTIIFFKLLYYYRFRYFSSSLDPFFENILADINIKLHGGNKLRKDRIISELKKQKMIDNT